MGLRSTSLVIATCSLFLRGFADRGPEYYDAVVDRTFSHEDSSPLLAYRSKWIAEAPPGGERARREVLRRLGLVPPTVPLDEPAKIVRTETTPRHHGDGGTYVREVDQFGDKYGTSPGAYGWDELAPFFNVARPARDRPTSAPRFLREAAPGFPKDARLSPEDLVALEPLPVRDPLRSYLGGALVRLVTGDADKPMPKYDPEGGPMLAPGSNYFRRADGTYYLYDIASSGIREYVATPVAEMGRRSERYYDNYRQMMKAIAATKSPDVRRVAMDYLVDTVFLFPEIAKHEIERDRARLEHEDAIRAMDIAKEAEDRKTFAFVVGRTLASFAGVRAPGPRESWRDGRYLPRSEGYLQFPLLMLRLTEAPMEGVDEGLRRELRKRILDRVPSYRERMEAAIRDAPDDRTRRLLRSGARLKDFPSREPTKPEVPALHR